MLTKLVTCPESAHLEQIDYEVHALGHLVFRCSAFGDRSPDCARTCAARLDKKRETRRLADGSVLIVTSCLRRS